MFDSQLQRNKPGNQSMWTKSELLAGLQYFYELYGKFPTAHEIEAFETISPPLVQSREAMVFL